MLTMTILIQVKVLYDRMETKITYESILVWEFSTLGNFIKIYTCALCIFYMYIIVGEAK